MEIGLSLRQLATTNNSHLLVVAFVLYEEPSYLVVLLGLLSLAKFGIVLYILETPTHACHRPIKQILVLQWGRRIF